MKVAVCLIAKNEEQYLVEWVEHYKTIGFDNVLFYDNNENSAQFKVLKKYIDNHFVKYHDKSHLSGKYLQKQTYMECFKQYSEEFDWIAFYDADEFVYVKEGHIKDFLTKPCFKDYCGVFLNWKIYDDSDLIHNDGRPLKDRFKRALVLKQTMGKTIINTHRVNITYPFLSVHFPFIDGEMIKNKVCDADGNNIDSVRPLKKNYNDSSVIKHYYFKTVEEGVKKIMRGDINVRASTVDINNIYSRIDDFKIRFFEVNKKTPEKVRFIEEYLKRNLKK